MQKTGKARSINRKKFQLQDLERELADPTTRTARVFNAYSHFLSIRKGHPAFNPLAPQQILSLDKRVFALLRTTENNKDKVLCLINITQEAIDLVIDPSIIDSTSWVDLLSGHEYLPGQIVLKPYQVLWLE